MEININPSDIDVYVKNAIMESTVGKNIKEGLEKALKDVFSGYRNPVEDIMKRELERIIKEYMEKEEVKEKILNAIAKVITPDAIETVITYGVHELRKRYENN